MRLCKAKLLPRRSFTRASDGAGVGHCRRRWNVQQPECVQDSSLVVGNHLVCSTQAIPASPAKALNSPPLLRRQLMLTACMRQASSAAHVPINVLHSLGATPVFLRRMVCPGHLASAVEPPSQPCQLGSMDGSRRRRVRRQRRQLGGGGRQVVAHQSHACCRCDGSGLNRSEPPERLPTGDKPILRAPGCCFRDPLTPAGAS